MPDANFLPVMDPVESSNVHSIGYDEETQTLFIRFWKTSKSGRSFVPGPIYKYFDVPKRVYVKFYYADSKGQFVWKKIRDKYRYKMIGRSGWRKHAPSRKKKRPNVPAAARNRARPAAPAYQPKSLPVSR